MTTLLDILQSLEGIEELEDFLGWIRDETKDEATVTLLEEDMLEKLMQLGLLHVHNGTALLSRAGSFSHMIGAQDAYEQSVALKDNPALIFYTSALVTILSTLLKEAQHAGE